MVGGPRGTAPVQFDFFIEFLEELPKTMTQKVQKYKLQESAQDRLQLVWDREKAGIKVTR